jgi:hypothetical protein
MNSYSTRATVGITALVLAAALSLSGVLREGGPNAAASAADPSVPPASQAFKSEDDKKAAIAKTAALIKEFEGNVQDMTY